MLDKEIGRVLTQMRALESSVATPLKPPAMSDEGGEFATAMRAAIDSVNERQAEAAGLVEQFQSGAPGTSVAEVMIAMQKASISFQAATEVRNRLVEAYREIMNMPV